MDRQELLINALMQQLTQKREQTQSEEKQVKDDNITINRMDLYIIIFRGIFGVDEFFNDDYEIEEAINDLIEVKGDYNDFLYKKAIKECERDGDFDYYYNKETNTFEYECAVETINTREYRDNFERFYNTIDEIRMILGE